MQHAARGREQRSAPLRDTNEAAIASWAIACDALHHAMRADCRGMIKDAMLREEAMRAPLRDAAEMRANA